MKTFYILPRAAGEGDRAKRGGGGVATRAARAYAPSVGFAATSPVKNGGGCFR